MRRRCLQAAIVLLAFPGVRSASAAPLTAQAGTETSVQEQYALGAVGFESMTISGPWSGRDWAPYLGKYHRKLEGIDFYTTVGREDLASRYRSRQAVRYTLMFGGLAASVVGFAVFAEHRSAATIPFILFLGGGLVTAVGWYMSADPVDESEARQAADVYNKTLKRRLGLEEPPAPAPDPRRLTFAPFPLPGGMALSLGGAF